MSDDYYAIIESLFGNGKLRLDAAAEYELRHDDFVMEMPQSASAFAVATRCARCRRHFRTRPLPNCAASSVVATWRAQWVERM
jgi:hypothetical protein